MKQMLFGNPNSEFINFKLDGVSKAESCVSAFGELRASWFAATLPLVIEPGDIQEFLEQLSQLDRTLKGTATLRSRSLNGPVTITVEGLSLGHIRCSVDAALDDNYLRCTFKTDQTQLSPLLVWWKASLDKYQRAVR